MATEKEIRIKIKSVRYEVGESLFSELVEDGEFDLSMLGDSQPDPEVIEINTFGKKKSENGRIDISYEESEVTGMDGSTTSISYDTSAIGVVSMIREGAVSTVLVFEEGKRHHCVYNTPFMPFEVCVHTLKVENNLEGVGSLSLDYVVEIRGAKAERTKFTMQIL